MNPKRYSRHIALDGFGAAAQERMGRSKVLVVGSGGLGLPVLSYLNAMGLGHLGIVDGDVVETSNLHRQVLFNEADVGRSKVEVVKERLHAQNSHTHLEAFPIPLTLSNALEIISGYDLVVDATDNFPARYLINDACVILGKPFVYGALHGFEGQVSLFNFQGGPTYRCLFPNIPRAGEVPDCNIYGVLGVLPGIVGDFQALEVVKALTGIGETLSGKLLIYDGLTQEIRKIRFARIPERARVEELLGTYGQTCEAGESGISYAVFSELIKRETVGIIDVRTPSEFVSDHLSSAINIPLPRLADSLDRLPAQDPVYVVCRTGQRALRAVAQLRDLLPQRDFVVVEGGLEKIDAYAHSH